MAGGPRAYIWQGFGALCVAVLSLASLADPIGSGAQAAPRATCQNPTSALGVSRVLEIDTSTGPRFGHQQYKDLDFLSPGEVVLTFDDGPLRPHTQPIVDALEAQCTKATFFMVGSQAIADPDMVRQIIRNGHTVGTHTWSHANLRKSTPLKARQEIELGFSAVAAAAGQPISPFFRFPFLADTKAMMGYAQTRRMGIFSIEVDSLDYKSKSAAAVHRDVLAQLAEFGKGIILFHDIQPATAQALPGLLEALKSKGYKVVHLKPKAMVATLPEFDAVARDGNARKQMAAATQPLAPRAVTWGSASPSVSAGVGFSANPNTVHARATTSPQQQGWAAAPPQQRPYGVPSPILPGQSAQGLPSPTLVPNPPIAGIGDQVPQPSARIARQPPPAEDWRDKVFNR